MLAALLQQQLNSVIIPFWREQARFADQHGVDPYVLPKTSIGHAARFLRQLAV